MLHHEDGLTIVSATGDLDLSNVADFGRALENARETTDASVVVDLEGLKYADSTTIQTLLQFARRHGKQHPLFVVMPSGNARRVFEIIDIADYVPTFASIGAIREYLTGVRDGDDDGRANGQAEGSAQTGT